MRAIALLSLLCAWLVPWAAAAQSANVSMSASASRVAVGEPFAIEIRASVEGGEVDDVVIPDFGKLEVLGRRVSRPFSFSFGFGGGQRAVMKSEIVHSFTLRALEPGSYRIEPAVVVMGRRKFTTRPLTIEASGAAMPGLGNRQPGMGQPGMGIPPGLGTQPGLDDQGAQSDSAPPDGPLDGAQYDPNMFVRTVVDKPNPYVGEQVTVTVYLYVRGSLHQAPTLTREPTTEGFWVHDLLPPQRSLSFVRQEVNGRPYHVYVLRRFAAFALREGELKIGAPHVEVGGGGSLFDLLTGPAAPTRRTGVDVTVPVRALPARGQSQRSVHVGTLSLEATLDPKRARVGDAVTLTLRARGTGNLKNLEFDTPVIDGAEVLTPEVHDEVTTDLDQVGGERTWRWLVLPRKPSTLTVPSFAVDVFDTQTGSYRTVETTPLTLEVTGQPAAAASAPTGPSDGGAGAPADDTPHFGPVRTDSELARKAPHVYERRWFGLAVAAAPLCLLLLFTARFVRRIGLARSERAGGSRKLREAQSKLSEAGEAAARGDSRAALGALEASLKQALEARLGEPIGGFTRAALRSHLKERGMAPPLADRLVSQLETCELARFDPAGKTKNELETEVEKARGVLRELERFAPRVLAALALLAFVSFASTASADASLSSTFLRGNRAFAQGKYAEAITAYETLIDSGVDDPDVTFNLASAHGSLGHFGQAMRYFERTLVLRPSDDQARAALRRAREALGQRQALATGEAIVADRPPLTEALFGSISGDALAFVLLVSVWLFAVCVAALVYVRAEALRLSLGIGAALGLFSASTAGLGLGAKLDWGEDGRRALVIHEDAPVREGPDDLARLSRELAEGTPVRVLDREGSYVRIRAGEREGFMRAADVGEI